MHKGKLTNVNPPRITTEPLFAAKYMAYMPTEEELSREIEQQKRFFLEQHGMEE